MEIDDCHLQVCDASAVGAARRVATELARSVGIDDVGAGRVALVVTELGNNLLKHAGGGELLLTAHRQLQGSVVDVVALDSGPGMADVGAAMRDGFSSAGTAGNGLGAVARLAAEFDAYSRLESGTVVFARTGGAVGAARPGVGQMMVGAVHVPYPGERVSGDGWAVDHANTRVLAMLVDGLGHGPVAAEAAQTAVLAFAAHTEGSPGAVLTRIHEALRPTRGAAVAVAEIDRDHKTLRFAGLGNIAGTIVSDGKTRSTVSHHGTAGHDVRRVQEFSYPWSDDALLVLNSDGLVTNWSLDPYPGLLARHPMVVAAVLYRDFRRGRDDATVVVLREPS